MEKIWLGSYPKDVSPVINSEQYNSIWELFKNRFSQYAANNAYVSFGKYLTYQELEQKSRDVAAYLQNTWQLKAGDRVAIMLPNILQYPIMLLACLRAGLVVVNINPLYTARELQIQLQDSGATTIIIVENFANVLQEVIEKTALKNIIVTPLAELLAFPKKQLINFALKYIKKAIPTIKIAGAITFTEVMQQGAQLTFSEPTIKPQDLAFLQYTGGTTGGAKGAMLSHGNIIANVLQAHEWIKSQIHAGKEIIITALPLYHIFSLTANCLTFMMEGGLNVLIANPKDIKSMVKTMSHFKFTAITGVNTLFNALNNYREFQRLDLSCLHLVLSGGMSLQQSVAHKWHQITKVPILEAYGLTETSPAVCISPFDLQEYNGSVGLPISSTDVAIIDEQEQELPLDTPGELVVAGPQVMQGYWQKPQATQEAFTKNGFFKTGDIATIDSKGFVRIVDRKKDMIIVSGFNVYPNEIEDVVMGIAGVLECAAVGVEDSKTGEAIKLYIVAKSNVDELTIKNFCKHNLTKYKIPKYIEFCSDLPKSTVGKVLRKDLRDPEQNNAH